MKVFSICPMLMAIATSVPLYSAEIDEATRKFFTAIERGSFYGVEQALAASADMHATDSFKRTALMVLAGRPERYSQLDESQVIAQLLIEQGKLDVNHVNELGWSALMFAVKYSRYELASFFLKHGAYVFICAADSITTPLSIAQNNHDGAIMELLRTHIEQQAMTPAQR